ncbi:hypothetical protein Q9189_005950 [Teloschistes chrysophthalmus]
MCSSRNKASQIAKRTWRPPSLSSTSSVSLEPHEELPTLESDTSRLFGFGALAPCLALSVGKPGCFPPASTIVNCNLVASIAKNRDITSLMTVPSILEDFTHMGEFDVAAQILARLKFVACGGGGLKIPVEMTLESKGVTLLNHFGATELGTLAPIFQPESDYDWRYLRVRSDLGLELQTLEPKSRLCKLVGYPFAWNTNFELQDRLERNPLNEREVKILGRNDDLIVLATGEKVLPHPLEQAIEQHPLVRRAIAFGNGQTEFGFLVDPMDEKISAIDLIEKIWPSVLAANSLMDHHAWVSARSAILVKPLDKSIPLSDKGSAQRREVYKIFETEIASVYQRLEASQASEGGAPFDLEHVEETLRSMAPLCLPLHAKLDPSDDDEDFVNLGMDSLKATKFRRLLNASLRTSSHEVYGCQDLPSDFIYAHPSISRLAKALKEPIDGSVSGQDTARVMKALTSKYAIMPDKSKSQCKPHVIVLTGSTGNLGAHMLAQMAELDGISRVICMLRPQGASSPGQFSNNLAQRQTKALQERGMQLSEKAWLKIHLLPWQAGKEFLGLGEDVFQDLASQVTHIFHGAWPMDFKMKVSSFEPQIKAVRDLIELARLAHGKRPSVRPRLVLASSIAVLGCYSKVTSSGPVVPEVTLNDPFVALPLGYAQAKWCCEKIIESAQESIPGEIECMIVRIGQISGSQTMGYWSPKEHFPALVKACQDVKAVPNLHGTRQKAHSWLVAQMAYNHAFSRSFIHGVWLRKSMRKDLCSITPSYIKTVKNYTTIDHINLTLDRKNIHKDLLRHKRLVERCTVVDSFETQDTGHGTHPVRASVRNEKTGKEETIRAKFLVGADGAGSSIRKQLDIPFDGVSTDIYWAITDCIFETDFPYITTFG